MATTDEQRTETKGQCLCGAVTIHARGASLKAGVCHCGMCRRWGGGPLMTVEGGSDVAIIGEENVAIFKSSEWAERGFCKNCGSHLFYRLKQNNFYAMPAGLFDCEDRLMLDHQIFIDHKPAYYDFANATAKLTEAEVFAQFAPAD